MKILAECQFKGFIGANRYAYRAFHDKALGCTKIMMYAFISAADGWCCITENKISGHLDAEAIRNYAEKEARRIENL